MIKKNFSRDSSISWHLSDIWRCAAFSVSVCVCVWYLAGLLTPWGQDHVHFGHCCILISEVCWMHEWRLGRRQNKRARGGLGWGTSSPGVQRGWFPCAPAGPGGEQSTVSLLPDSSPLAASLLLPAPNHSLSLIRRALPIPTASLLCDLRPS